MDVNKSLILNKIKSHYSIETDAEFARFLEIKPQTLYSWHSRNTFDVDLVYAKCEDIDGNWLLTGRGKMLKNNDIASENNGGDNNSALVSALHEIIRTQKLTISSLTEQIEMLKKEIPVAHHVKDASAG